MTISDMKFFKPRVIEAIYHRGYIRVHLVGYQYFRLLTLALGLGVYSTVEPLNCVLHREVVNSGGQKFIVSLLGRLFLLYWRFHCISKEWNFEQKIKVIRET